MIVTKVPWTSQPQSPVPSNCAAAFNFSKTVFRGTNGVAVSLNSAGSRGVNCLVGSGASYAAKLGGEADTWCQPRTGPFTEVFQFKLYSVPGSGAYKYVWSTADAGYANHQLLSARGNGSGYFALRTSVDTGPNYVFSPNTIITAVVQRKGTVVTIFAREQFGVTSIVSFTDSADYYNRRAAASYILGFAASGYVDGELYLFGYDNTANWDIATLAANPWQIFAPQVRRIWTPDAAVGGFTAVNRRTLGPRVGSRSYY